jgi:hypothetical protein
MKIASSFLYDLVHKLSKSEKRYLKVQQGNGEKDYLALMKAILAQKGFDENQLIKDNEGANFLKHLSVNKRYLYEIILKSLTNFGERTIEDQVFEKISATNVLINKALYQAAFKELKKGLKIAKKHQLFELQIMLLGIEKRIRSMRQFKSKDKKDSSEAIFNNEKNCLDQLMNTNQYWFLNHQISQFQMKHQKIQTAEQKKFIGDIINSPKFKDENLATNIKSKIFYFQANATYQFMQGKTSAAYEYNKQFLDFLESKPQFLKLYAERYLATLNNLLIDIFGMGKYDMLEAGIKRLDKIPERAEFKVIKNIDSSVFRQKYLLLLNWSLRQQDYKKALEYIPQIEIGIEQFGKTIEKHHRITFYYLCAYILFINQEYKQAQKWNDEIIYEPKEDVVKEILYFARILNLIIHYELDNFRLLDSLILSTPKYLKARREIYQTEKTLFSFLRKMRNSIDQKEKRIHIKKFRTELDSLFENKKERRVFSYLDLRIWMNHYSN